MTVVAPSLVTTKRLARLGPLPLACGATLPDAVLGYETYGRLNAAGDNAVLVCHHFTGHSHAAGVYGPEDAAPGWWDAVIGPGKAIDTERHFVIAADALGCLRTDAPHGVTSGPQGVDPGLGRPYGPDFPPLTVRDSVEAQRRLLDQLGVRRLAAVAGPSYGAMQALEWALGRPDEVDRAILAIAPASFGAREIGLYRIMEEAIRLDPDFRDGRYGLDAPPRRGLAVALELMTMLAGGREEFQRVFGRQNAGRADAPDPVWAMEAWLVAEGAKRAEIVDANAFIGMLRTNMRWDPARGGSLADACRRIRARMLLIPSPGDDLLPEREHHLPLATALATAGVPYSVVALPPRNGHLAGMTSILDAADAIRRCLETPVSHELETPVSHELETPVSHKLETAVSHELETPVSHDVESPVSQDKETPVSNPSPGAGFGPLSLPPRIIQG